MFTGVREANTMASNIGLSKFHFKFREEFYGYAGGKPPPPQSTAKVSPA